MRIKGYPNLRKDTDTGAVLNVNPEAVRRHAHHQQGVDDQKMRDAKIETLESKMDNIERLLKRLLGEE